MKPSSDTRTANISCFRDFGLVLLLCFIHPVRIPEKDFDRTSEVFLYKKIILICVTDVHVLTIMYIWITKHDGFYLNMNSYVTLSKKNIMIVY